ncbi:hypothetical protein ACROYT_G042737 [Oculina patagonica]
MASSRNRLGCVYVYFCTISLVFVGYMVSLTDGKCDRITLTGKTGEVNTPNYPRPYPSHSKCSWLIQAPPGYKIKLQFYHFVLEASYDCQSDHVKIYDGRNSSATLLGKYCGRYDPFHVETFTNNMFIIFRSDRSLNFGGFRAFFNAIALRPLREMSFRRTLKNITVAVIGKQAKLQCQVKGGSLNVVILWFKDGKELSSYGSGYTIRNNVLTKRSTLLLDKVSIIDAGVYSCLASDADSGKNISAYGSLQLKEAALVKAGPSPMDVYAGQTVIVKCRTSGDPVPKISWQVNGQDKTGSAIQKNFTSELHFKAITDAVVNCTADNGYGMDWKTGNISVLTPATVSVYRVVPGVKEPTTPSTKWSPPVITVPPANTTAELGDNVTLKCAAEGNPKPKIRWLAEDKYYEDLPEDDDGVSYFTFTVSKKRTSVRCEAQNIHNIDTRTAYVTVANVEAVVAADASGGLLGQMTVILVTVFIAFAVLVILIGALIFYRRRNLKLRNLSTPVDLEKLQNNPIFDQHTNYYVNPQLLSWAVPRNTMEFIKELGQGNGNFSSLFLGSISEIKTDEDEERKASLVMVKLLKGNYTLEAEQANFEKDAIALTTFSHPCVQSLFGVCVDGLPLCLVFEFSEHDECLQQFLIESARGHCSIHRRADMHNTKPKLSNIDHISIAKQIANGMEYLSR